MIAFSARRRRCRPTGFARVDRDLGQLEVQLASEDPLLDPLQHDLARPPLLLAAEAEVEVQAEGLHPGRSGAAR